MTDWTGAAGQYIASGFSAAVALVSYGMLRQKVKDLDVRTGKNTERIDDLASVKASVDLLAQSVDHGHTLIRTEAKAAQDLAAQTMDGLRSELRAFLQGQASAGQARAQNQPQGPRRG